MLNAKLERHMAKSHALLHEISAYIYIYIYIDDYSFITSNHSSIWVSKKLCDRTLSYVQNKYRFFFFFDNFSLIPL